MSVECQMQMLQAKLRKRSFSIRNFRTRRDLKCKITAPFFDLDRSHSESEGQSYQRCVNRRRRNILQKWVGRATWPEPVSNARLSTHPSRQLFLWHAQNSVEAANTGAESDDPSIAKWEISEASVAKHFVNIENVRYGMHLVLLLVFAKSSSLSFWWPIVRIPKLRLAVRIGFDIESPVWCWMNPVAEHGNNLNFQVACCIVHG